MFEFFKDLSLQAGGLDIEKVREEQAEKKKMKRSPWKALVITTVIIFLIISIFNVVALLNDKSYGYALKGTFIAVLVIAALICFFNKKKKMKIAALVCFVAAIVLSNI